jgi:hypothetical protein
LSQGPVGAENNLAGHLIGGALQEENNPFREGSVAALKLVPVRWFRTAGIQLGNPLAGKALASPTRLEDNQLEAAAGVSET